MNGNAKRARKCKLPISGDALAMAKTSSTMARYGNDRPLIESTACEFCDHAEETNDPDGCALGHAPRTTR